MMIFVIGTMARHRKMKYSEKGASYIFSETGDVWSFDVCFPGVRPEFSLFSSSGFPCFSALGIWDSSFDMI